MKLLKQLKLWNSNLKRLDSILRENFKISQLEINDTNRTDNNFQVFMVSEDFKGTSVLERHKKVM